MRSTDPTFLALGAALGGLLLARLRHRPERGALSTVAGFVALGPVAAWLHARWLAPGDPFLFLRNVAWGVFLLTPLLLLGVAALGAGRGRTVPLALAALLVAAGVYAFAIEPRWLEVTEVTLRSDKLDRPLRIAVIADLQTDDVGDFERRVLERVAAERPDLILLPGDYVQVETPDALADQGARLNALLRDVRLEAPLGAHAVQGNMEWPGRWPALFRDTGVTAYAATSTVERGPIALTALSFGDSFDTGLEIPAHDRFHVVFGHGPDFALGDVRADLLLAGHTHGGQVRMPGFGALLTFSRVPRAWAAGVTPLPGGRTLIVSRGIGMERHNAPRLRFLCRPELLFVTVLPEDPARAAVD